MTASKIFVASALIAAILLAALEGSAQSNTPAGTSSVPSGSGTPFLPPAYGAGILVNSMKIYEPQQPFTSEASVVGSTSVQQVNMTSQYADGLGRPMQTVVWQMSPAQKDLVAPVYYDATGMTPYAFSGYTSTGNDGSLRNNPFGEQSTFYGSTYQAEQPAFRNEQFYYSHTIIEPSPANRVSRTFSQGNSWAGSEGTASEKAIRMSYLVNGSTDVVQAWTITSNALTYTNNDVTTNIPSTGAAYGAGTLTKTVAIDEKGQASVEYKDFDGHVVFKKVQVLQTVAADYSGYSGFQCTYFVYDDAGQLRFIIPPKVVAEMIQAGSFTLNTGMINELSYRFEYDLRQRMIARKSPGAGWTYFIYDQRDRGVFTQDANMRQNNQWQGALYDALDRPVQTGMMTYTGTPAALQAYVTANTGNYNISSSGVSGTSQEPSVTANVYINNRVAGVTLYQASNSITFDAGFTSEDGASWVGQIVSATPATFTNGTQVSDNPIPSGNTFIPLTVTNYDNYSATGKTYDNVRNAKLDGGTNSYADPLPAQASAMTRGLVTSTKVRAIENAGDLTQGNWMEQARWFDDKGRVIQVQQGNYKGGLDVNTTLYNFYNRVLCTYEVHNNVGANINNFTVKTNYNYDHAGRLLNVKKNLNDDANAGGLSTTQRTVATYVYDALGRVKEKQIGQKTVNGSAPTATPLEDQSMAYNIRGWLKGINWNYPGSGPSTSQVNSSTKWFGADISYDWGYGSNQFNGSVAGLRWMSGADGQERSYGYGYDISGRLLFGDFSQNFGGSWAKSDPSNGNFTVDFTEKLGDGLNTQAAYDDNGNILQLQHNGLVVNASPQIDNLAYTYENGGVSNKLRAVTDNASQPAGMQLGDFMDKSTGSDDYGYDVNGNQITDMNKRFNGSTGVDLTSGGAIVYSYLNLPYQITVKNDDGSAKGSITYIYDAMGNKLEKRISELAAAYNKNVAKQTTDSYLGGFVYENNALQYFGQEEGRIRPLAPTVYNNNQLFAYDYYLKDYLGNVRTVLTDELRQDIYPAATLEAVNPASIVSTDPVYVEEGFNAINTSYIVSNPAGVTPYANNNGIANNNPNCNTTSSPINQNTNSNYMYRINGSANKSGLGITVRVMAGDHVDIFGKTFFNTNAPSDPSGNATLVATDLLTSLLGGPTGNVVTHGASVSNISNNTVGTVNPLNGFLSRTQSGTTPVAYINYVIFSDQFKYLGGGTSPVRTNSVVEDHHADLQNIPIPQDGYIYIYASNQSPVDVYFDNLQVVLTRGPLLQTNSYYPTGLMMAGISGIAANELEDKMLYTEKELQHQEFTDGTGMEEYDMAARYYDPQLGRWNTQDPSGQYPSPYLGMGNNWPNGKDPSGKWFGLDDIIVSSVGFLINYVGYGITKGNWGGKALLSGLEGAAIAEGGYLTFGGGLSELSQAAAQQELGASTLEYVTASEYSGAIDGWAGTMSAAWDFAGNYGFSQGMSILNNFSQLKAADGWQTVGLLAGYSAVSSISAGLSSNHAGDAMDKSAGTLKDPSPNAVIGASPKFAEASGWGNAISNLGNDLLSKFDPKTGRWPVLHWGNLLMRDVFFGWGGGYYGQELENAWYMDNGVYDFNNFQPSFNSPIWSFLADKLPPATGGGAQALAGVIADWIIPKY